MTSQPKLRDPVVLDGTKYRIRSFGDDGWAALKTSFGQHHARARVNRLVYDPRAGVWRCDGGAEYGHGLSRTVVHSSECHVAGGTGPTIERRS